jgi:hypothetical protein
MAGPAKKQVVPTRVWNLICEQERAMIADVDAIRVSGKPEVIGALFENAFREFLARLLPSAITVTPGFIVEQNGRDSSHFDALLVDNSYPFLASVGPHRYVMAAAVVGAIELTTRLDAEKIRVFVKKGAEIERISNTLYEGTSFANIGYYAVCVDAAVANSAVEELFKSEGPYGTLCVLRGPRKSSGYLSWMEGKDWTDAQRAPTNSPLADFISLHLQDGLYALASRDRDAKTIGSKMNDYIHWGTSSKE